MLIDSNTLAQYVETTIKERSIAIENGKPNKGTKLLTPVLDSAPDFLTYAKVEPNARIFVNIGTGAHLEMTFVEASIWIEKVITGINQRIEFVTGVYKESCGINYKYD
ncbi:hypothetical protein V1514DRAFT_91866 [Lipomyces japonicus]|uniref:uncharacterized protein n=1 Tax=Lipomyces japonicus TaxID=56871 RepID=UPI0034CE07EF